MTKSKKLHDPGAKVVTEARLASLLSRFAKAADAALGVKMQDMEERLRAEFVELAYRGTDDPNRAVKKPTLAQRVEALERANKANAAAMVGSMVSEMEKYLHRRQMDGVYAEIHKEMERIKADLLSELSYQTVHVDVRHTRDGKEV